MKTIYQKQDIEFHDDGSSSAWGGGTDYPAIDVKCRDSVFDELKEAFPELTNEEIENIGNRAWEEHRELFWEVFAQEIADDVWGDSIPSFDNEERVRIKGTKIKFVSAGRSGGWLVVTNLGDVEVVSKYWTDKDVALWSEFVCKIDDMVNTLTGPDSLIETVSALLDTTEEVKELHAAPNKPNLH